MKKHPSQVTDIDGAVWRAEVWPTRKLCPAWLTRDARWLRLWVFLKRTGIVRTRCVTNQQAAR